MELHCPETGDVVDICCEGSHVGAELLLQTLAWQDDGRSAALYLSAPNNPLSAPNNRKFLHLNMFCLQFVNHKQFLQVGKVFKVQL